MVGDLLWYIHLNEVTRIEEEEVRSLLHHSFISTILTGHS